MASPNNSVGPYLEHGYRPVVGSRLPHQYTHDAVPQHRGYPVRPRVNVLNAAVFSTDAEVYRASEEDCSVRTHMQAEASECLKDVVLSFAAMHANVGGTGLSGHGMTMTPSYDTNVLSPRRRDHIEVLSPLRRCIRRMSADSRVRYRVAIG